MLDSGRGLAYYISILAETKMNKRAEKLAKLLKVLSVATRLRIVDLLKKQPLCVNAIAIRLSITQGAVSQHLRIMRDAGLVIDEKRGYYVHYRLNEETIRRWKKQINELLEISGKTTQCKGALKCVAKKQKNARSRKT